MYELIKNIILAGGYKLEEIQHKVQKMYILGTITESQMDELFALASAGVSTDAERPDTLAMFQAMSQRIDGLEERLAALEGKEPEPEEYEEWKPWDGVSNKYQLGAIVRHNGKLWESTFNGQNVWEPGAPGTDSLWKVYNAE